MNVQQAAAADRDLLATAATERAVLAEIAALPEDGWVYLDAAGCIAVYASPAYRAAAGVPKLVPIKAWTNRAYTAQLYSEAGGLRLTVQRTTASAYIRPRNRTREALSWEELQAVKAELGFADEWAVEVYPPAEHEVNVSDMRHLWLVPAEMVPFAWRSTDPDFYRNRKG